jgi:hypothetical protein
MRNKILVFTSLVLVLTFGFLYINQSGISANDKEGKKDCTHSCSKQNSKDKEIKAGGDENSVYAFITDKACCDEMKTSMQNELMGINGVKEVKFGSSCNVSKMTQVSIYYSAGETNEAALISFIKDKEYNCPDNGNCPHGKCNMKKSTKDAKNI